MQDRLNNILTKYISNIRNVLPAEELPGSEQVRN